MKFSEKLIELRKKEGLSQEELGYKLNVTRQTISKWELEQTTPEMEKLVEMSKIFKVSVDELINDTETISNQDYVIQDQPIVDEKPKRNRMVIIIVVALILVIIAIIGKAFTSFSTFDIFNGNDNQGIVEDTKGLFGKIFDLFDKTIDSQLEDLEEIDKEAENIKENVFGEVTNKINTSTFNGKFELYNGSNRGTQLKRLLEDVITSNKKEDRKITIKYLEIVTQDPEEIQNLKMSIKDYNNFEVSFDYDENGYIYQLKFERIFSEMEKKSFNSILEMYSGTKMGGHVISLLDQIITSNKTEDIIITVKFNQKETQVENEIKNIKQNIGTFNNYDVTLEYDADGFVNKAIIEKI